MPVMPLGSTSASYAMDVKDHPSNTVPNATEHHDGTVLGIDKLRNEMVGNFISPGLRGASSIDRMEQNGAYDAVGK